MVGFICWRAKKSVFRCSPIRISTEEKKGSRNENHRRHISLPFYLGHVQNPLLKFMICDK